MLLPFFNNLTEDADPLLDKERFYILRAIARVSHDQRELVLKQAAELSMGRPSYAIVESLCIINSNACRGVHLVPSYAAAYEGMPNGCLAVHLYMPEKDAGQEMPIINPELHTLIYAAIKTVSGRYKREILAECFLARDEQGKEKLAKLVIDCMAISGKYIIETGGCGVIELLSNGECHSEEARNLRKADHETMRRLFYC